MLPTGRAGQMAALASAGLVQAEDAETNGLFGGKVNVRRYNLADAAKPYIKERAVQTIGNGTVKQADLCWGKKTLDKIVKWEGPMKLGDYQEAGITYTYQVNGVADWARKPEVLAAFPEIKSVLDGAGNRESKHVVKLTSQGWEARGLD